MATTKKKKQQSSPLSFIFMAVFAYLIGLPIWMVLLLVVVGVVTWQIQKSKKAMDNLPSLPPREQDLAEGSIDRRAPVETDDNEILIYEDASADNQPPPWAVPDYQPQEREPRPVFTSQSDSSFQVPSPFSKPMTTASSVAARATTNRPYASGLSSTKIHPLARNLSSRQGLQQAIVALTVLGPPRALQPHQLDPSQQADVAPSRIT
jgi:hypothetical protein